MGNILVNDVQAQKTPPRFETERDMVSELMIRISQYLLSQVMERVYSQISTSPVVSE